MKNQTMRLFLILVVIAVASGPVQSRSFAMEPDARFQDSDMRADAGNSASDLSMLTAGIQPTIALAPNHGYMGQEVVVSGQGVAPYPGVRVVWLTGDATRTAAVVGLDAADSYRADLTVPGDATPGTAQICATVTGTELAEFACAAFIVDAAPPGSVTGQLSGGRTAAADLDASLTAFDATLTLRDNSGTPVASTPILVDGSYNLAQVEAGNYHVTIEGQVPTFYQETVGKVLPGMVFAPEIRELVLEQWASGGPTGKNCSPGTEGTGSIVWVSTVEASPAGFYVSGASGPAMNVTFRAWLQELSGVNTALTSLSFYAYTSDGTAISMGSGAKVVGQPAYAITYNVSTLPEDVEWVVAKPLPQSGCGAWGSRAISVIANPMDDPLIRDGTIAWNSSQQRYDFSGTMPKADGVLPLMFPDPPPELPLIGEIRNQLDAGIEFVGSMELDGDVVLDVLDAYALAELLSVDLFNERIDLSAPGEEYVAAPLCPVRCPPGANCTSTFIGWEPCERRLPELGIKYGPRTLAAFAEEIDVYSGIVATYWYVVTVNAGISIGLEGDLVLEGTFRPLAPRMEATLTPRIEPSLTVSLWLDLLFGLVSAGADVSTGIGLYLPLEIDTEAAPAARFEAACLNLAINLNLWAEVDVIFWKDHWDLWSYPLVHYRDCIESAMDRIADSRQTARARPPYMAAPSVTGGPDGRMLSVYVENTAPEDADPVLKIMARFWDQSSQSWGPPAALTDGSRVVMDPTAAFVGPSGQALVVWTENMMTRQDYVDLDDDIAGMLPSLELYYARWDGASWGAAHRLTNNNLPDGMAALAGDAQGATLAWVRDNDGDIATRTDWYIVVSHWNPTRNGFGSTQLLDAGATLVADNASPVSESAALAGAEAAELHVCSTCGYTTIQAAVDTAAPGDVIKVAGGSYTGVQTRSGVTQLVYLDKSVIVQGGYTPEDWTAPYPEANSTILDAEGLGRVIYVTGGASPTIDGLHLTGGDAAGLGGDVLGNDAGGGVYVRDGGVTIRNSLISSSTAEYGGGLYLEASDVLLEGNTIASNTASHRGGGVLAYRESGDWPVLSGNVISGNLAYEGGGLALISREPAASHSRASLTVGNDPWKNNVVAHNRAAQGSPGILASLVSPEVPSPRLWHTTLAGNSGGDGTGVGFLKLTGPAVMSNTIIVNQPVGVAACQLCDVALHGVLWYGNTQDTGGSGSIAITDAITGTPEFATDGYHLTDTSAAIDRATSSGIADDIDGDARPLGMAPDLGADECVGGTQAPAMNAQVSVDRKQGRVLLAWTMDADGELTTNGDRRIAVADCSSDPCSVEVPADLPAGADSPSVAVPGPDKIHLAFLHRGKDGDGVTDTGMGNRAEVWVAEYGYHGTAWNWAAHVVRDRKWQVVYGERPRLSTVGDGKTLLLFRRFGPTGSTGYLGQLALTKMVANGWARPPIYLSDERAQHWQPALAINQATGQAMILDVSRAPAAGSDAALNRALESLTPVTESAMPDAATSTLSATGDPVQSLTLEAGPDPALDPALSFSQQHPTPGSAAVVTATVRNVGREPAAGLEVNLYAGTSSEGLSLDTASVPGELDLNDSYDVGFEIVAGSGSQPLFAQVTTIGEDVGAGNNVATGDLGELPAPPQVYAASSIQNPQGIQVSWLPPAVPDVSGYRILRSETSGGPYELVGEAAGLIYTDLLLEVGQPYYYVVQVYDDAGIRSGYSVEAWSLLPKHKEFLPLIVNGH
jgi:hypothetical protein